MLDACFSAYSYRIHGVLRVSRAALFAAVFTVAPASGLVLGALSLVTLRFYVHIAPLWIVLAVSGALLALAALAVQRVLMNAEGQELHGFTARPLFRDESRNLQAAAVVLAFTPSAQAGAPSERGSEFRGGGGDGGGGGASDSF